MPTSAEPTDHDFGKEVVALGEATVARGHS